LGDVIPIKPRGEKPTATPAACDCPPGECTRKENTRRPLSPALYKDSPYGESNDLVFAFMLVAGILGLLILMGTCVRG
jgi:hypothetical protein